MTKLVVLSQVCHCSLSLSLAPCGAAVIVDAEPSEDPPGAGPGTDTARQPAGVLGAERAAGSAFAVRRFQGCALGPMQAMTFEAPAPSTACGVSMPDNYASVRRWLTLSQRAILTTLQGASGLNSTASCQLPCTPVRLACSWAHGASWPLAAKPSLGGQSRWCRSGGGGGFARGCPSGPRHVGSCPAALPFGPTHGGRAQRGGNTAGGHGCSRGRTAGPTPPAAQPLALLCGYHCGFRLNQGCGPLWLAR